MNLAGSLQRQLQPLFSVVIILACIAGITGLQLPQLNNQQSSQTEREYFRQENLKSTNLEFLKQLPSFGYRNLMADWMYLQFIQYFGDSDARDVTGYQLIPRYFQGIIEKDPHFGSAYLKLSSPNSIFAGEPKLTVKLLDQALQEISPELFDNAHQLWIYKGTDELLFLGDLEAAKQSYKKAAEWAEKSDQVGSDGLKRYAERMIQFIETNPDTREGRIGAWGLILNTTDQETVKEEAIKEIEALGGEVITNPDGSIRGVRTSPQNENN